ncbi:MAG: hypothetical protein ACRCV9_17650, partial [Burkholderiaceae bacterium]
MTNEKPVPLPHCEQRIDWARLEALGEVREDYWRYRWRHESANRWHVSEKWQSPDWADNIVYEIVKGP